MRLAGGLFAGAVLAAAAWFLWPDPAQTVVASAPPPALSEPPGPVRREATTVVEAVDNEREFPVDDDEVTRRLHDPRYWNAVKRHCPWPPDVASWEVIDPPCLSAMNAMRFDDEWRRILADPGGTRRAVVVALDDHQCRVPRGESRPDLFEACAASAMVVLAELQRKCVETAHVNMHRDKRNSVRWWEGIEETQEEYHRRAESDAEGLAYGLWKTYMCRADMDALAWIEALPEPPDDLSYAGRQIYVSPEDSGTSFGSLRSPRLTQDAELYALARRLGAEVPDWVQDDVLPW